ncbi:MAG: GNAT family N-acetyltransferase [bacterium]
MNVITREATEKDVPNCAELLHALFSQELEFHPDLNLQIQGLTQIINSPDTGRILVAETDHKVIGMVSLLFSISTALGGKVATLEDLIIQEPYRKQGIGKQLIQAAFEFAKNQECLRITLLTDHTNNTAIRFYESFGFTKSPMIPLRKLL